MAHIVILGAGLGGVTMAYEMREIGGRNNKISVISERPTFQFTPSNPWVAVGWRQPKQIETDLTEPFERRNIDFIPVAASRVVPENNYVQLTDGREIAYDFLVIATGPHLAFEEIEGLGPHGGFTQSVCTTEHAVQAWQAYEKFLKSPGPVIIGAVQGASCFGPAYEFAFILETALRKRKIRNQVPMTYVTSEPYIGHLGLDGVGDTKGILESELRNRHIKWITNTKIEKVTDGQMVIEEIAENGTIKDTWNLPFAYSMILPAFRGVDAVMGVENLVNPRGLVLVDEHQRNPTYKNVFGIGVCIAIPPMGPTPVPVGVPKTGFMIDSMAAATARNIRDMIKDKEPAHEATWNAFCLADFGDKGVAFLASPQIPPRNANWASKGRWVHLAKVLFERYFLRKVRTGTVETVFETLFLKLIGLRKIKH